MLKLLKIFALPTFKRTATRKNKKTILALNMSDEAKDEFYTTKQNYLLEHSYLGTLGRFISPIFAPALSGGRA